MDKWFAIYMVAAVLAIVASSAVPDMLEKHEKSEIIIACYNAHQPNCDKLWSK